MPEFVKVCLKVTGRVQGVFYRQTSCEQARLLGLSGWVRNLDDGSVELEARGAKDKVESLINWCKQGPPRAHVDNVEIQLQASLSELETDSVGFKITD